MRRVNRTLSSSTFSRSTAEAPPTEFFIQLRDQKARVTTSKLPGSPNYLYSVYLGGSTTPVLERITRPDKDDVQHYIATLGDKHETSS